MPVGGEKGQTGMAVHSVSIKRVYEAPTKSRGDGLRVLVDRLWPRGVKKGDLEFDSWPKDVTPSPDLRKWYAHDVERWDRFVLHYQAELDCEPGKSEIARLRTALRREPLTLLTAVKDVEHSAAAVIAELLRS